MDSADFDLNTLRALDVLLRERQVSRAARVLGISQPAMSRALARLREQFGDDLLVRSEAGFVLTARAETLIEPVRGILTEANALVHPVEFDPASLTSQISIVASDLEMRLFLPPLLRCLSKESPNLTLRALQFGGADFNMLDRGEADFALTAISSREGRYRRRLLFNDSHVTVMNSNLARRLGSKLSLEDFVTLDHGLVSVEGHGEGFVDKELRLQGLRRRVVLRIPNFTLIPAILASRDIIFTVPRCITRTFARSPRLHEMEPPLPTANAVFYLYWHARNHHNPAHSWFRKLVFEVSSDFVVST